MGYKALLMSRNTEATEGNSASGQADALITRRIFAQLLTDELAKASAKEVVRAISIKRNEPGGCWNFVSMPIGTAGHG
ncbi:hypothetical protein KCP77_15780 [Salmonella enterica subsp. enterica]|nr:hypothetical protein KCP77_15780 [Salmonella enterica subsp. enterica]